MMRWNDSATGWAAAVQILTMPVATLRVVVAAKIVCTADNSAGGEPPTQIVP